jgi:hypothetical protein
VVLAIRLGIVALAILLAPGRVAMAQTPPVAPDHSLSQPTYIEKGLPAPDRLWTGLDYGRVAEFLESLAAADATQLPRLNSATSGGVFGRIVSADNLNLLRVEPLSSGQRLSAAGLLLQNVSRVLLVYASATTKARVFDSELVELMNYTLEICREMVLLTSSVFSTLPTDDPQREARLKGRDQMRQGMATMVNAFLTSLTEHDTYRSSELVRLAQKFEQTLPTIVPFLPAGSQQELPVRIRRMIDQESDPALKESLVRISAALPK